MSRHSASARSMITDEMVDDLTAPLRPEPEIIELSILAAAMGGFASINVALNIAPDTEELQVFDFADPANA